MTDCGVPSPHAPLRQDVQGGAETSRPPGDTRSPDGCRGGRANSGQRRTPTHLPGQAPLTALPNALRQPRRPQRNPPPPRRGLRRAARRARPLHGGAGRRGRRVRGRGGRGGRRGSRRAVAARSSPPERRPVPWGRRGASQLCPGSPRGMDRGAVAEAAAEAAAGALSAVGSRMAAATGPCQVERSRG